jgi:hypothetical protein
VQQRTLGFGHWAILPQQHLQKERLQKAHLTTQVALRHRQALVAQHMLAAAAALQSCKPQPQTSSVVAAAAVRLGLPV